MNEELSNRLATFAEENDMSGRGPLCVALVVTRHAKRLGLPMNPDDLMTERRGQVAGLGRTSVQSILRQHGIHRVLAEEGGRTSRGSVGNMRAYVHFLNSLNTDGLIDFDAIEDWWVEKVISFFSSKPFVLRFDVSKSLRSVIRDLLEQAEKRQREGSGTMYVGAVIQHLVGAKLDLVLGGITHFGASVADEGSGRDADFLTGDTAIHVTSTPGEGLIRKCERNLSGGLRPVIVTSEKGTAVARGLAEQAGVAERIDVLDVEQFISGNLYEHGRFESEGRRDWAEKLIARYNEVVQKHETDPSMKIILAK
jgi:hypothetical protein